MSAVLDRFLRYVGYNTRADEHASGYPRTEAQLVLLQVLADELRTLGLVDVTMDVHGYVMATIPATSNKTGVPTIETAWVPASKQSEIGPTFTKIAKPTLQCMFEPATNQ